MLRLRGDNGKPNDNMLMHILSPYPEHRSALTDIDKLRTSGFNCDKAILIYGYEDAQLPISTAIDAFETLARSRCVLSKPYRAAVSNLVHPVHASGEVVAWQVTK